MPTTAPLDLPLLTADGEATTLGAQLTQPLTIVQLVRYYGCLPCQEWAVEIDKRTDELAARGIGVVAVGGGADYQAQYLRDERGIRLPLLLDPDQGLRDAVGAMKPLVLGMIDPRSGLAYLGAMRRGYRQESLPSKDAVRSPGIVVLDRSGTVVWQHVGTYVGDYPSVDATLATVSALS
jgi:peroxiredoxin